MKKTAYHPKTDAEMQRLREQLRREDFNTQTVAPFRKHVYNYYARHGRVFPWRENITPYRVLVSELMLQQTQTERVVPKYIVFIDAFPDFMTLANASLHDVLGIWQGLGYNRRALFLKRAAEMVVNNYDGVLPECTKMLRFLPGIGPYTAAAIRVFAFNKPDVLIETNIRTVFIHLFFPDNDSITDAAIRPLVELTVDGNNPREWYYALMDYGSMLKLTYGNPGKKSAHYRLQSPFEGSNRQLRGFILRKLADGPLFENDMYGKHTLDDSRVQQIISGLEREGFIIRKDGKLCIP